MSRVVVLLSGGMDSATVLARAAFEGHHAFPLSVDYGQKHVAELTAAQHIAQYYGLALHEITLPGHAIFRNALSSQVGVRASVPHGHYAAENMKLTIVPNRNMLLLAAAGAYAISNECSEIWYGAHAGDHAIYPDCRPQFVAAMQRAFELCDWKKLELRAPFISATKSDIVTVGTSLHVPYHLTYSCYEGLATHCGECGTCVERREAFQLAGVPDPTLYEQ